MRLLVWKGAADTLTINGSSIPNTDHLLTGSCFPCPKGENKKKLCRALTVRRAAAPQLEALHCQGGSFIRVASWRFLNPTPAERQVLVNYFVYSPSLRKDFGWKSGVGRYEKEIFTSAVISLFSIIDNDEFSNKINNKKSHRNQKKL